MNNTTKNFKSSEENKNSRRRFLAQSLAVLAALPFCAFAKKIKPHKQPILIEAKAVLAAKVEGSELFFAITENQVICIKCPANFLEDFLHEYEPMNLTKDEFLIALNHKTKNGGAK